MLPCVKMTHVARSFSHKGKKTESPHLIVLNISATQWPKWTNVAVPTVLFFLDFVKCFKSNSLTQTSPTYSADMLAEGMAH